MRAQDSRGMSRASCRIRWSGWLLAGLLLMVLAAPRVAFAAEAASAAPGTETGTAAVLEQLQTAQPVFSEAVAVRGLRLDLGMAKLQIDEGVLIPTSGAGASRASEILFVGSGRLQLKAPNEVEAGQLELFSGSRNLSEPVAKAVLAIGSDAAVAAILDRDRVAALDPAVQRTAAELFRAWRNSAERRLLGIEEGQVLDALGDVPAESFFAGRFEAGDEAAPTGTSEQAEATRPLLYVLTPEAREQVTLGQFVPVEASKRERRKLVRALGREQRRGRLIGMSVEDLGDWDTWISTSLRRADGSEAPGGTSFDVQHYKIDVRLDGRDLDLAATVRMNLRATHGLSRFPRFEMLGDLQVSQVRDGEGRPLFFQQAGARLLVELPSAPAAGEELALEVDYAGSLIERLQGKSSVLRTTESWLPRADDDDMATYDATFVWPKSFELVAGGVVAEDGQAPDGRNRRRYTVDRETLVYSFEVGRFKTFERRAGIDDHIELSVSFDEGTWDLLRDNHEDIVDTLADSLTYFEETFGPYPLHEMRVVTVQRGYSQAMLGFVTLSSLMMADFGWLSQILGFEDHRTVIAHEISHQWWGHLVGWKDYRDQWISEAMANFSAVLYARNRLTDHDGKRRGPTSGWQSSLLSNLDDGRNVEALGPLVLGGRLLSSRSDSGYQAIVYQKGALVLEMLSRLFGEENFLKVQRALIEVVNGRKVSTDDFLHLIERLTGEDLQPFAQQFVYDTGLTEVYYDYTSRKLPEGTWLIEGVARQSASYFYQYGLVRRNGGGFDIERTADPELDVATSRLIVPVEIEVYDPQSKEVDAKGRKRRGEEPAANKRLSATTWIKGTTTELHWEVSYEPRELYLDRQSEVFGIFYNERRNPKRSIFYRAIDAQALGDPAGALDLLNQAAAAEVFVGTSDAPDDAAMKRRAQQLAVRIDLLRARCLLNLDRDGEAMTALERADDALRSDDRRWYGVELGILQARVALRAGDAAGAHDRLRKALKRGKIENTEGQLLYALTAKLTGQTKDYQDARELAVARGADVSLLDKV